MGTPSGIGALMLDVDGVILRGRAADGGPWTVDLARDLGIAPARLEAEVFAPHWRQILTGAVDLASVLERVLPRLAPGVGAQALIDYRFAQGARQDGALIAALARIRARGLPVWLATNQDALRAVWLMRDLGLARHVDGMIDSASLGAAKPDAAFFDRAAGVMARQTGLRRRSLLLIDDTKANVASARANGWRAEQWTGGEEIEALLLRLGVLTGGQD